MASLKEVKGRISSINGTLKITSAMKMVASSKLHKAQEAIENMLPYEKRLHSMLKNFIGSAAEMNLPYMMKQDVKKVAVVVFASNSSLCGGFNANVIRHLTDMLNEYASTLGKENIRVFPIGRKVAEAVKKLGYQPEGDYQHMSGKPNAKDAYELASLLVKLFVEGEVQQVELLYNHFKSTASQVLTRETYLPFQVEEQQQDEDDNMVSDYIVEPSKEELLKELLPKVLRLKIYTVLLDSAAAEHAARTMAMQIATDNANDLIQALTLQYNKGRQQAITNELLDIVGGTMS